MTIKSSNDNKLIKKMNREIFQTAYYHSTILSKYALILLLILFYTYTAYKLAPARAIIYILVLIFLLPLFTQALLSSLAINEDTIYFPSIRKKYDYSAKKKMIHSSAMIVIYIVLIIWQWAYTPLYQIRNLYYYPTYILSSCLGVRILLTLYYYRYIKKQLEKGNG